MSTWLRIQHASVTVVEPMFDGRAFRFIRRIVVLNYSMLVAFMH